MSEPTTTDPTGLDYHAAYQAMFPGLKADGVRIQDLQDTHLKTVDRAARLRRAERERVKDELSAALAKIEEDAVMPVVKVYADRLRKAMEEIR